MFAVTRTPLSLAPEWQDLLLGSSPWAKRIFTEVSALESFPVPTQPLETLRILPSRGSLSSQQDQSSLFIFIYSFKT